MLAVFCARLALGCVASLALVPASALHAKFPRTQFLTALGLFVVAALTADGPAATALFVATGLCLLGAISWTLDPAPAGRTLVTLTSVAAVAALALVPLPATVPDPTPAERLTYLGHDLTSAALLGTSLTAMLAGHAYLIAPAASIRPLLTLLGATFAALALKAAVVAAGAWHWLATGPTFSLGDEVVLWLPVRVAVGLLLPAGFAAMALLAARIRSTQSATGILYVVVICCFLGELLSLLLTQHTGLTL